MVLADAGQAVVEAAAAVFLVGTVVVVTATWLAVRSARRRLRRWRHVRAAVPWAARGAGGLVAAVATSPVTDPRWWTAQQQRHQMWRAVSSAERAVRAARSASAPTGDLRMLVHQLRSAARSVDAAIRAGGADKGQTAEVVASARQIQQVATDALLSVARPESAGVAAAVEVEVAALRHGLAAAAHR
jgi:hypothetical protein